MTEINDPAVARRRRKAIIQSQRSEIAVDPSPSSTSSTAGNSSADEGGESKRTAPAAEQPQDEDCNKKTKVQKSRSQHVDSAKKKTQIRYDPDVPMSKEQLAAWRREARRVRNRESAAASRHRIKSRITELEDEVADWKSKYAEAMERLQIIEKNAAMHSSGSSGS